MMKRVMYRMLKSLMITLVITLVKNQIHILIRNHKMIMKELLMKKLNQKKIICHIRNLFLIKLFLIRNKFRELQKMKKLLKNVWRRHQKLMKI